MPNHQHPVLGTEFLPLSTINTPSSVRGSCLYPPLTPRPRDGVPASTHHQHPVLGTGFLPLPTINTPSSGRGPCHLINSSTPCLACNPANPQQQHALSGVQPCQPSSTAARPVWRATLPPYQQQHALSGVQPCHI